MPTQRACPVDLWGNRLEALPCEFDASPMDHIGIPVSETTSLSIEQDLSSLDEWSSGEQLKEGWVPNTS